MHTYLHSYIQITYTHTHRYICTYVHTYIYSTMTPNIKGTNSSIYSTLFNSYGSIFSGCCLQH